MKEVAAEQDFDSVRIKCSRVDSWGYFQRTKLSYDKEQTCFSMR